MSKLSLEAVLRIVDQASKPLKALKQGSNQGSDAIENLTRSINRLNQTLDRSGVRQFNQSLGETSNRTHMVHNATSALINDYHEVSRLLTTIHRKSQQWADSFAQSRKNMRAEMVKTAVGTFGAGAAIYKFLTPAFEFEKQMSTVQAVLNLDKTSSDFKMLEDDARLQGARSSFSPAEAAQAQFELGSGGFNPAQIKDALAGTLNLAEAGKVELPRAAEIAVGTLNGFSLAANQITRVSDVFVEAGNRTAVGIDDLGETMKYIAPIAHIYGASLEQATAMTGLLGNANIKGSEAGTALRSVFTRLAAPPKEAAKALANLGIKTTDSTGKLRDISDVLAEVNKKTSKLGNGAKVGVFTKIAGQEAVSAFTKLVEQANVLDSATGKPVNNIKELTNGLEKSQLAAFRAAAILKNNLYGDVENMGGAFADLSISFNKIMGADLRKFVQQITAMIDKFKIWVEKNPELVKTIGSLLLKLLMFKVALLGVRYSFNLLFGTLFGMIAALTKFGILLWVIQKIAGKLGIGLPTRLGLISRAVRLLGRAFIFLARQAIPILIRGIIAMTVAIFTNPLTLLIVIIVAIALAIRKYWQPIKAFFTGFWDGLTKGLAPVRTQITKALDVIGKALEPLRPLWDWFVDKLSQGWDWFMKLIEPVKSTKEELDKATSAGEKFGKGLADLILGIVNFGATLTNAILSPIRQIIDETNTMIGLLNKIPGVNISLFSQIPEVPHVRSDTPSSSASSGSWGDDTPSPKAVPTKPIPARGSAPVTQHFAAANITITGATDVHATQAMIRKELETHQRNLAASGRASYSDRA